jgi:hypothetical protein
MMGFLSFLSELSAPILVSLGMSCLALGFSVVTIWVKLR